MRARTHVPMPPMRVTIAFHNVVVRMRRIENSAPPMAAKYPLPVVLKGALNVVTQNPITHQANLNPNGIARCVWRT